MLAIVFGCGTAVGQVVDEAELDDDEALEIEEVIDTNDDALSGGKRLKLALPLPLLWLYESEM